LQLQKNDKSNLKASEQHMYTHTHTTNTHADTHKLHITPKRKKETLINKLYSYYVFRHDVVSILTFELCMCNFYYCTVFCIAFNF